MSYGPSLSRRLSVWLALQGLAGTMVICAVVYLDARASLSTRQEEALANKQAQVLHLLQETRQDVTLDTLRHKLDDFFVGHDEVALELRDAAGALVYASLDRGPGPRFIDRPRSTAFATPEMRAPDAPRRALLYLDVGGDERLLRRLALTLVASAIGASALAAITGYLLVRTGLAPIGRLASQARRLRADTLHRRLSSSEQPEELAPLVGEFNELLSRLDHAYTQLEAFNADVAHELCTPLATLISGSEVALRRTRDGAELQQLIGSNLEELRRLADIVQDMLFLSRADRGAHARRTAVASMATLAAAVIDYHEAALEAAGVMARVDGDAPAEVDAPLLRRALSNLIVNGTRYAVPGSVLEVRIAADAANEMLSLSVRNQGPPIADADLSRIFDRFYRVDRARSSDHENHGLGLAIVAAIARMHAGEVFAASRNGLTEVGLRLRSRASAPSPQE